MLIGLHQELRNTVIVVLACWLDVGIVEIEPEVVDVLKRLNPEGLPGCTRNSLRSARLKLHPIDRNTCDADTGGRARVDRFDSEFVTDILFRNGVGVSDIGEVAGRVIGQRIAVDDSNRTVDDHCHHRAELFVNQGVRTQILGTGSHGLSRRCSGGSRRGRGLSRSRGATARGSQ